MSNPVLITRPSHPEQVKSGRSNFLCSLRLLTVAAILLIVCTVAANAQTVITRIEEKTGWSTCGACGNTGGTGAVASYAMARGIASPTKDGSSTRFSIGGATPFKNAYWYIKHLNPPTTPLKSLKYEFDLFIPSASANAPQAIEFECEQKIGGKLYNFAWQAEYPSHVWRVFNYTAKKWEATTLQFETFTANTWHHIIAEYHVASGYAVHDALTIDGVRHVVNIRHAGKATSTGRYLSTAFQLDLNGSAADYKVYVDGMKITYQ